MCVFKYFYGDKEGKSTVIYNSLKDAASQHKGPVIKVIFILSLYEHFSDPLQCFFRPRK